MNRSLDELTASELNAAIDDTNFPKARSTQCLSQSQSNGSSSVGGGVDETNSHQNGKNNHATGSLNGNDNNDNENNRASDGQHSTESPQTQNGIKGFIKRAHPAPLKMVAFKGDSIDVPPRTPGTPRTPRTSTTPGNIIKHSQSCNHLITYNSA